MSNRSLLLVAAGAALLYFLSKTAMDLNRLVFKISGFRNLQAQGGNVSLIVDILVLNPTGSTFPLYDTTLDATVLVNNFALGKTMTRVNALLMPGQQIIIPLEINLSASNFAGGIAAILATIQNNATALEVLGTVTVKGVPLPLKISYSY